MKLAQATLSTLTIGTLALGGLVQSAAAQDVKADVAQGEAAQVREQIDTISESALDELIASNANVQAQYDEAAGYAVFRATKGGFIVTGAGGTGVAVNKQTGERTYMHMGSGGVALGAGLQSYRAIFLFETEAAMERFVAGGWDASATAQAAAGKAGKSAKSSFVDGVAVYQLTDKGLMAQADVSGTRFWKSEKLDPMPGS